MSQRHLLSYERDASHIHTYEGSVGLGLAGIGIGMMARVRERVGYTHDGSEEVHHRVLIPTATTGRSRSLGGGGQTTEGALRERQASLLSQSNSTLVDVTEESMRKHSIILYTNFGKFTNCSHN